MYNPDHQHRQSIRLKGYDYSQDGLYFITLCTFDRKCFFGYIENSKMILNAAGNIAEQCWTDIPNHFPQVILHDYVIMPNHIHGIVEIVGANQYSPAIAKNISPEAAKNISPLRGPSQTIGSVVRGFKIGVTKWMRQNTDIQNIWQRNYYEHIIRDHNSFKNISNYIINNPSKWEQDSFKDSITNK